MLGSPSLLCRPLGSEPRRSKSIRKGGASSPVCETRETPEDLRPLQVLRVPQSKPVGAIPLARSSLGPKEPWVRESVPEDRAQHVFHPTPEARKGRHFLVGAAW